MNLEKSFILRQPPFFLFHFCLIFPLLPCLQYSPVDHSRPTGLTPNHSQGFRHIPMPEKPFSHIRSLFFIKNNNAFSFSEYRNLKTVSFSVNYSPEGRTRTSNYMICSHVLFL